MNLPITSANVHEWFPAPAVENPLAGDPWWQMQCVGLYCALQFLRLIPSGDYQQQALVELRRALDTGLLTLSPPPDEEVARRMTQTLAPWCPAPFEVVTAMLDLANLQPHERLLDLGSGDGRIVFAAALRGAHALGLEIDARFVAECRERSDEQAAYARADFYYGRIEDADWGTPDVVTCYLVSSAMGVLTEKFRALRPGTRIVSYAFDIPGWPPTQHIHTVSGLGPIYLWVV